MLVAFHKPFGVLSQRNQNPDQPDQRTLEEFSFPQNLQPLGRLDLDSEGLLLLGDEPELERKLLRPTAGHTRTYLAQVEGAPETAGLNRLRSGGLEIRGHCTAPCEAQLLEDEPDLPRREPPVRNNVQTSWLELELTEGKNRQVRRMTAAIGHPTLRLIRIRIGTFELSNLEPGTWKSCPTKNENRCLPVGIDSFFHWSGAAESARCPQTFQNPSE